MEERRQSPRTRSYIGGRIVFNKGAASTECVVRNLSQHGARLVFSDTILLPDEFKLTMTQKSFGHEARIVWRNQREAGIAFAA